MRIRTSAGLAAGIVLALGAAACSSSTSSGGTAGAGDGAK
ncbi:MAG: iron-siderophore ABC transporter substrate-binding protein, partial [Catenulispora sp.]|nr:iron-siderophore ABC transporter substrate-binding protein [Catenulispora sp.]